MFFFFKLKINRFGQKCGIAAAIFLGSISQTPTIEQLISARPTNGNAGPDFPKNNNRILS